MKKNMTIPWFSEEKQQEDLKFFKKNAKVGEMVKNKDESTRKC
jgi:hypothetical protein